MKDISYIIAENGRRNEALRVTYDPVTGEGACGDRTLVAGEWLPDELVRDHPDYPTLAPLERRRVRVRYDFEYWAATCATIKDKLTGQNVRFRLNAPQRRLLGVMEGQRRASKPIRVILLKARQWGGSTLVQMYMAWFQLVLRTGWNSLICGHKHNTSRAIKQMYRLLLRHYPEEMKDEQTESLKFANYEGSRDIQQLDGRDCLVICGSSRSEDAVRGFNLAMAHLTEVAFWASSTMHAPEDLMRSVLGTVMNEAGTIVVLESTANGVGNFFHNEWLRAQSGHSDKVAVFVPWYEIELYRQPVRNPAALWASLDEYERRLWDEGCTLEMLAWYHCKRKEYSTHTQMMEEFPSNDIEAFANTGNCVFDLGQLDALRQSCRAPLLTGDIEGNWLALGDAHVVESPHGPLQVWHPPEDNGLALRYLVTVDVGGRSDKSDWSVMAVLDLHELREHPPEVVAQWRGHLDHDLLAWKAVHLAQYYHNALLVIESNTLETEYTEGDGGQYILNVIGQRYSNLYSRSRDRKGHRKYGFHTNRQSKRQAIYRLIAAVRERQYVERSHAAIDEMSTYELTRKGGFEAMAGHHDDILMTRAIALQVISELPQKRPAISDQEREMILTASPPEPPW